MNYSFVEGNNLSWKALVFHRQKLYILLNDGGNMGVIGNDDAVKY